MDQKALPDFSPLANSIAIGTIYEHYKGMCYQILAIARHTETVEELVVYKSLHGGAVWVRPLTMFLEFLENVTVAGKVQPNSPGYFITRSTLLTNVQKPSYVKKPDDGSDLSYGRSDCSQN